MSVVGWLSRVGVIRKEGNEGERCAEEAEEDCSLLSHARTLPRREAFLTGESGATLNSEVSTLN
jgi:hypothetical protein